MMGTLKGNCYCKAVEYTANSDDVVAEVNCHCSVCRKLTGSAFSCYVGVKSEGFHVTKGEDKITVYNKPDSTISKNFCKDCGTPLFNVNPKFGDIRIVYAGSLEEGTAPEPTVNIFCDNKMDWLDDLFARDNFAQEPK